MAKVLIVEDEASIREMIALNLHLAGMEALEAESAEQALTLLEQQPDCDAAILDVMLPGMNGFSLCETIRRTDQKIGIIILSAKGQEQDKIRGLSIGADDYMTKPFRPLELVARVKSQLRRYKKYNPAQAEAEAGDVMTHAGLEMNVKAHQCLLDGKSLTLTPTEFSILQLLLESKGTVVSAEELFYRIWADEYYSKTNNTITSHIRHLREKLNDTMDNPKYIRTIWGVGYKIED